MVGNKFNRPGLAVALRLRLMSAHPTLPSYADYCMDFAYYSNAHAHRQYIIIIYSFYYFVCECVCGCVSRTDDVVDMH